MLALYLVVLWFALSGIASILFSVLSFGSGDLTLGLLWLGTGLLMAGTAILLLLASNRLAKRLTRLCRKVVRTLKVRLVQRRDPA